MGKIKALNDLLPYHTTTNVSEIIKSEMKVETEDHSPQTGYYFQDMTDRDTLFNDSATKTAKEKVEIEEKLAAATQKIYDLVEKDTINSMEIESNKFKLGVYVQDLH